MTIVVGLDVHREQITFDALDTQTGEVRRGRIRPADRQSFRRFLRRFEGQPVEAALEATTGWRFIVEELAAAGAVAHLAEPADTSPKRRPSGAPRPTASTAAIARAAGRAPVAGGLDPARAHP